MQKNIAGQTWTVFAFNRTDNTPKTGDLAQITAKLSKDGAAGVAMNDVSPVELEAGYYEFTLTQAETNYDKLTIIPVSGTADIQVVGSPGSLSMTPAGFPDNVMVGTDNVTGPVIASRGYYGDIIDGESIVLPFNTFANGESAIITDLVASDVIIIKDGISGGTPGAGVVVYIDPLDVGINNITVDTSDTTDANFFEPGHDYYVYILGATVAGKNVNATIGSFSIENRHMIGTNGANVTVPDAAGVAPTATEIRQEIDANSTKLDVNVGTRATSTKQNSMETTLNLAAKESTLSGVKTQTDKLDNMITEDVGGNKFTTIALENAPSGGGGGDATEAKQNAIIDILEADSEINDDDPAQHKRIAKKKSTAIVLFTKDLFKPDGNPVTSIEDVISSEVEA